MLVKPISLAAALGVLAYAHGARADAYYGEVPPYSYAWGDDHLRSLIGLGLIIGGGVSGFTNQTMRDNTSSVGGLWNARISIGTHVPIGLDINYVGTATTIEALGGPGSATLLGTTVEGALRWNMLPHYLIDPYVFAGVGWQHYDVNNFSPHFADANIKTKDDFVEIPLGLGISFRDWSGFVVDLRGTFRAAASSTLVFDPRTGNFADMHAWEASGALGYEF
jgi:hypothetical protein